MKECERCRETHPAFTCTRFGGGDYRARYVVLALGKRGTPRKLGVEGEDLPKVSLSPDRS